MRWNRGTAVLIAALLIVIVGVLVINSNQASAPGETPTPAETTGALLPIADAGTISRYEVRDNTTGDFVALNKDSGGAWDIDATNALSDRDAEQSLIDTTTGQLVALQYTNSFTDDQLATFGLDAPAYTVFVTTDDGSLYAVYVGDKSPTSPRYYTVVEKVTAQPTAEPSAEVGNFDVQPGEAIASDNLAAADDNMIGGVALSDVTENAQIGAGATLDAISATAAAQETPAASAEMTAEASAEAPNAIATDNVAAADDNTIGGVALADVTAEPSAEMTADMMATMEAAAATVEMTAEATPNRIQNPGVTLSGEKTIYLIPQTVIDTLTRWLQAPPYAPTPTAAPDAIATEMTDEAPITTEEAVGVNGTVVPTPLLEEGSSPDLIPAGTPIATSEVTPEATAAP